MVESRIITGLRSLDISGHLSLPLLHHLRAFQGTLMSPSQDLTILAAKYSFSTADNQ